MLDPQTTPPGWREEYQGPIADARAAAIEGTLGTDAESLPVTVWLLRYTTVQFNIQWPTTDEMMEIRHGN